MKGLELRQATEEDDNFLYHLKKRTLKHYVECMWGEWNEAWQRDHFRKNFDPSHIKIVILEGKDIGMLQVERKDCAICLGNIHILPQHQNQGIGTALVRSVLHDAREEDLPVRLQVLKVNPAKRLYERLGFRITDETETHYLMECC